jgi:integrase
VLGAGRPRSHPRGRLNGPGIDVRHARACRSRAGGRCNCAPTYQAHVFDARTGRRIRRTSKTVSEAKAWRRDALTALAHGDLAAVTPSARRVADVLDELVAGMKDGTVLDRSGRRYRASTIRDYERDVDRYLKPALGVLRLGEVRRADVQRLVDRMHADGLAGSTVRNKLDPLRVVFRRAVQDDEVTRNPTEHLRLPALEAKPRRIGARERVTELLDALPDSERAAWACAFYAGLRVGELRALRWAAVDFDAGVVRVEAGWDDVGGEQDPKTAAGVRTIPLVGRLRAELARHRLATGRGPGDLCFGRTASAAFVRSTFRSRALRAWTAAGLEALTPHEARHTCASYLAAAGLTPKDAQTAMGHADIRTTLNIYAKAVPGWEEAAVLKLDAYLDEPGARQLRDSRPLAPSGS